MTNRLIYFFTLAIFSVFLQGCPNQNYSIVSPENGDAFEDTIPASYEFTYVDAEPASVALNGVNVIEYFTMDGGVGTADGAPLEAFLKQGTNVLTVAPDEFGPRVEFFVDTEGPSIIITEVAGDATKTISGKVQDPSGVNSLIVNGVVAAITGEEDFTVIVPDAASYSFEAQDIAGRNSTVFYATRDSVLESGLKVRVAQSALDEALPVTQEIIEDLDFNSLLADADGSTLTLFRESVGVNLPQVTLVPRVCTPEVCLPEVCTPRVCVLGVCTPRICTPGACTPEVCTPAVTAGPVNFTIVELEASLANVDVEEVEVDKLDIASGNKPLIGNWEGLSLDGTLINTDIAVRIDSYLLGVTDIVSGILNFLGLSDTLDALDGNFTAGIHADRLRLAADLGLTASNGSVDVTIADINAIGLNSFDSDFDTTIDLPDAFNLFGFGLAETVLNIITGGFADARDFMIEIIFGNIVPAIADPIVDMIIDEIRLGVKVGITNNTLINALFQIREIDVIDGDSALLVGVDSLIGAEKGEQDELDLGFSVGESADIWWVSDHILPDGADLGDSLGPAPELAPQALGYRLSGPMTGTPDSNGGDVSVLTSATLVNQALLAFYETALLQFSLGYLDGVISNEPNSEYTHRMAIIPGTPPELIFKGTAPAIAYIRINNFEIKIQEHLGGDDWNDLQSFVINAEIPVVISVEDNRLKLGLLTTDLDVISTNGNATDFTVFSMEYFLNRVMVSILIEQINLGLGQLAIPGTFDIEADSASLETTIEGISVNAENNLQINIDLNNG